MNKKIIYYIIFILWYIILYYLGIFIKFYNFNLIESQLFLLILNVFSFFTSSPYILCGLNINESFNKLYLLKLKDKILLYLSCLPFYKLMILSYIDVNPIIIQIINNNKLPINILFSLVINKKYYLCNWKLLLSIIINILSCYIILLFNNWICYLKITDLNINNFSSIGIILSIISVILTSLTNVLNENIKNNINLDNDIYIYSTYVFIPSDIFFSIIIFLILLSFNFKIDNIYLLFFYSGLFSIIYGPLYVLSNKAYLELSSIDIGIINNISFILILILNYSSFCYLYIPFIIFIIITSLYIIYKYNTLSNFINISITEIVP